MRRSLAINPTEPVLYRWRLDAQTEDDVNKVSKMHLIDNCSHFILSQHRRAVLLGESGVVVSFSRTFSYPFHNNLTITFEDENGASVDFHAWCARRPLWPLEYGLNNAKEWRLYAKEWTCMGKDNYSVDETVVFHQLRFTVSSIGRENHGFIIKVYAKQTYARAQYARSQRNELFVLRALVSRRRAKATSRTAPWLKWLLGAGSLALPDELARQVLGFWRPTE